MAVKLRLRRMGKKKRPFYRIVAADSRAPRDGRFIELVGTYDPLTKPQNVEMKEDRVFHWLKNGAQPTRTVKNLLQGTGLWLKWDMMKNGAEEAKIAEEFGKWQLVKAEKEKRLEAKEAQKKSKKAQEKAKQAEEEEKAETAPAVQAETAEEAEPVKEESVAAVAETAEAETASETETAPAPEVEASAEPKVEPEAEVETKPEAEPEAKAETEPEAEDSGEADNQEEEKKEKSE